MRVLAYKLCAAVPSLWTGCATLVATVLLLAGLPVVHAGGVEHADSWYVDSAGCKQNTDAAYNQRAMELGRRALGRADVSIGCVNSSWLEGDYYQYGVGNTHHAGLDLRVSGSPLPAAYAILGGVVVDQSLFVPGGRQSTLVIESELAGTRYRVYYLHCSRHYVPLNYTVAKGEAICQTGSIGAPAAHLHIEVKRQGTPSYNNMWVVSGSQCGGVCYYSDIIAMTVDPVDLIALETGMSATPVDSLITQCITRFQDYFGSRVGAPYNDYGVFRVQQTTGGWAGYVQAIAISTAPNPPVFWYYWYGWGSLDISWCR